MSDVKIGQLIGADAARDAIHVAIAPVVAAEELDPGDHVGLNADGKACESATHIGIVDPYLTKYLQPGDRFYLFLYPNTVIGMRHHWLHPAFMSESQSDDHRRQESIKWLKRYAVRMNTSTSQRNGLTGDYWRGWQAVNCSHTEPTCTDLMKWMMQMT